MFYCGLAFCLTSQNQQPNFQTQARPASRLSRLNRETMRLHSGQESVMFYAKKKTKKNLSMFNSVSQFSVAKLSFWLNKELDSHRGTEKLCVPLHTMAGGSLEEAAGPIKDDPDPKLFLLNAGTISASRKQRMWEACELMIYRDAMLLCKARRVASGTL